MISRTKGEEKKFLKLALQEKFNNKTTANGIGRDGRGMEKERGYEDFDKEGGREVKN